MLAHVEDGSLSATDGSSVGDISASYGVALLNAANSSRPRAVAQKVCCTDKHPYMAELQGMHALLKAAQESQRNLHTLLDNASVLGTVKNLSEKIWWHGLSTAANWGKKSNTSSKEEIIDLGGCHLTARMLHGNHLHPGKTRQKHGGHSMMLQMLRQVQ